MATLRNFLKLYEEHIEDIHIEYKDEEIDVGTGGGWCIRQDNRPEDYWRIVEEAFGKYLDYEVVGFRLYLEYDEGYIVIRLEKGG